MELGGTTSAGGATTGGVSDGGRAVTGGVSGGAGDISGGAGGFGAAAGDAGTGGIANVTGGATNAGAAGSAGAGNATGQDLVDCGGQNCVCCYRPAAVGTNREFECIDTQSGEPACGFVPEFAMYCDEAADCSGGQLCCMETTKSALLAHSSCADQCPVAINATSHHVLCASDAECATGHCVPIAGMVFKECP